MNQTILKRENQKITLIHSEIFDFIDSLNNLDIDDLSDLDTELQDMLDDVIYVYDNDLPALGLKKRIAIFRLLIQFFKNIELKNTLETD